MKIGMIVTVRPVAETFSRHWAHQWFIGFLRYPSTTAQIFPIARKPLNHRDELGAGELINLYSAATAGP